MERSTRRSAHATEREMIIVVILIMRLVVEEPGKRVWTQST